MAKKCQIKDGKFYAPNGEISILYNDLKNILGESNEAKDLFILAYTEDFKKNVENPIIYKYKKNIVDKLPQTIVDVKFKTVQANGFTTIQMFESNNNKQIGYIRLKPYLDGMRVERFLLNEGVSKGQGHGTELYKKAIKDTILKNGSFYADQARTQDAQRVWDKINNLLGLSNTLKISSLPNNSFDKNGEINAKIVIEYNDSIKDNNINVTLTPIEIVELKQNLPQTVEDSYQYYSLLNDAFIDKNTNLFNPSRQSLEKINLYSDYEIDTILEDVELQAKIKQNISKLKNLENTVTKDTSINVEEVFKIKTDKFGMFGNLIYENPLKIKNQLIQDFAGKENLDSLDERFESQREYLNSFKRVPIIDKNGDNIIKETFYDNAVKVVEDGSSIFTMIDSLLNVPTTNNRIDTSKVENRLIKELKNYGYNFPKLPNLNILREFLINPSEQNSINLKNEFEQEINEYIIPKSQLVNEQYDLVYSEELNTLSEQNLFDNFSLIETSNKNIYHRIEKVDFAELKDYLEISNDEITEPQAYKQYFNYSKPLQQETAEVIVSPLINQINSFNYLLNDFIADFNVEIVKGINPLTKLFKITHKGIEMISDDQISIDQAKAYIEQNVKYSKDIANYSLISKSIPNLIDNNNDIIEDVILKESKNTKRLEVVNNPQIAYELKVGEVVSQPNTINLIVKNNAQEYIKFNNNIYELQTKSGEYNFYSILNQNKADNNNYYYVSTVSQSSPVNLNNFITTEKPSNKYSSIKKLWTNEEITDNFSCI